MTEHTEGIDQLGLPALWSPDSHEEYDRLKGRAVFSSDGAEIGTICAVLHPPQDMPEARGGHYFLVESTRLDPGFAGNELYLSEQLLDRVEPERVVLAVPRPRLTGDMVRMPVNMHGWNRS